MYKTLRFRDPYGNTSLSARKTLLFCAYYHFVIPHDVVGAILYGEALVGSDKVHFERDVLDLFSPSLCSFVENVDWYLAAIESLGYPDIVEEFNRHNEEVAQFVSERFANEAYDVDIVREKVESLVPPQYMAIIKQTQK